VGDTSRNTADTFGVRTVDRSGNAAHELYSEAKDAAGAAWHDARKQMNSGHDAVQDFVRERPYTTVLLAFGIGMLLGLARSR
jgi:ElaB/YqjD/DUF883 family membrane-anchored ribosome-binding protein